MMRDVNVSGMLTRRQFNTAIAAAAATAALPATAWGQSTQAKELYRTSFIFDANAGPPLANELPLPPELLAVSRDSGISALKKSLGGIDSNFYNTTAELGYHLQLCEKHPDDFMIVRRHSDLEVARRDRKLGIVLSFESVEMLEGELSNMEAFRWLGVRIMQLTYNRRSPFGSGVLDPGGLTELGGRAVARMNEIGIALDLSHANEQTTLEALKVARRPPLITHAGCAAVHDHPRNKTDEVLSAVAEMGGVIGIYMLPYLTAPPKQPDVTDYLEHLEHALQVCGEDHVGIGSDVPMQFDDSAEGMRQFQESIEARKKAGVAAPGEERPLFVAGLNTPRKIELIVDAMLKRNYSPATLRKIIGGNFHRVLGEIWQD